MVIDTIKGTFMIDNNRDGEPFANPYAYTQTLKLSRTHKIPINMQYHDLKIDCHDFLSKFSKCYELYFEQHISGNLHVHGIVWVHDNVKRCKLLKKMTDFIGTVTWKPIHDLQKWREYCVKDKDVMDKVLGIKQPLYWKFKDPKYKFSWDCDEDQATIDSIEFDLLSPSSDKI